ncbi:MAG: hypothetical protein Q8P90_00820 [bacterium]|nr:hypothetical protein [bacterium]
MTRNVFFALISLISFVFVALTGCAPYDPCAFQNPDGSFRPGCEQVGDDTGDDTGSEGNAPTGWDRPFLDWHRTIDWSTATLMSTDWGDIKWIDLDEVTLAVTTTEDPQEEFRASTDWGDWCAGNAGVEGTWYVPEDGDFSEMQDNGLAVFLQPDGSIVEVGMIQDCEGHFGGWILPGGDSDEKPDVYQDDGFTFWGGHGGSHLSALGGTIRLGELTGDGIDHVLAVEPNKLHLYYSADEADGQPGYVWPAHSADSYASDHYIGSIPELQMGSLLAVPKSFNCSDLSTQPATMICDALQTYGGLVVDDSWGEEDESEVAFSAELGVREEAMATFNIELRDAGGSYATDIEDIFRQVVVITNPQESWPTPTE